MKLLRNFLGDELGADLAENVILIAFVTIVSTAVYLSAGTTVSGIWNHTTSQLAIANGAAPAGSANPPSGGGCHDGDDCDRH